MIRKFSEIQSVNWTGFVSVDEKQVFTEKQKAMALANLGLGSEPGPGPGPGPGPEPSDYATSTNYLGFIRSDWGDLTDSEGYNINKSYGLKWDAYNLDGFDFKINISNLSDLAVKMFFSIATADYDYVNIECQINDVQAMDGSQAITYDNLADFITNNLTVISGDVSNIPSEDNFGACTVYVYVPGDDRITYMNNKTEATVYYIADNASVNFGNADVWEHSSDSGDITIDDYNKQIVFDRLSPVSEFTLNTTNLPFTSISGVDSDDNACTLTCSTFDGQTSYSYSAFCTAVGLTPKTIYPWDIPVNITFTVSDEQWSQYNNETIYRNTTNCSIYSPGK